MPLNDWQVFFVCAAIVSCCLILMVSGYSMFAAYNRRKEWEAYYTRTVEDSVFPRVTGTKIENESNYED